MIESRGFTKHLSHSFDFQNIPPRDVFIESDSCLKHSVHILNARNVPIRDVLIEIFSIIKHSVHARNFRNVPVREITVKGCFISERCLHISHLGNVPVRHRADVRIIGTTEATTAILFTQAVHRRFCETSGDVRLKVSVSQFIFDGTIPLIIRISFRFTIGVMV